MATSKKSFKNREAEEKQTVSKPKTNETFIVGGIRLTTEQMQSLKDGGFVYLENMQQKNGTKVSAYLFFDNRMTFQTEPRNL